MADDVQAGVRYFVIQGSDSLDHWKTNLTFDPVPFEDVRLGVKVGPGAARGGGAAVGSLARGRLGSRAAALGAPACRLPGRCPQAQRPCPLPRAARQLPYHPAARV